MRALWLAVALAVLPSGAGAAEWLPVRETGLELAPGSPLDFSTILPQAPVEQTGRIVTTPEGRFAFAASPDKAERMLCASLAWSPASGGFPDHATADRYARQLAMHGYNIARLHFLDASLMAGRATDFDFDPEVLDRVHYLLAALKRNGIYWMMDGLSSWRGAYGGYDDGWDPVSDIKLALHLDEATFQHWKTLQEKLLGSFNPYTGKRIVDDEALALVVLVNENGIEFDSVVRERGTPHYDPNLKAPFNEWLRRTYGTTAALAAAWSDLGRGETVEDGTVELPRDRYLDSARMRDLQAFFVEVEKRTAARMSAVLRDMGYRGEISTYNNWPTVQTGLSRQDLPAITMNTYQDWVGGYAPGSKLGQSSSLADGANYMRMIAAARWLGRPFVVTEYDHLFWSRYRYEAGLVMPSYAALQGWDVLCRHGHGPIVLRYGEDFPHKRQMLPYAIALDPVARAGETLSALAFRRGDVSTARTQIPFAVRGTEDLDGDAQAREPEALTALALVTGIGLKAADRIEGGISVVQPRSNNSFGAIVNALRETGGIPAGNATDAETGRFESATGEIRLDTRAGTLRLSTARTEAAAFSEVPDAIALGALTIKGADGGAMVSVSALDDAPTLAQSRRLLLILATDARNTGMRFRDRDEKVIEDFGRLPALIRKGSVSLTLSGTGAWRISAVGLDGKVYPAFARGSGVLDADVSNDQPSGPTTFFLIERDGG